jgi:hypothetical protein
MIETLFHNRAAVQIENELVRVTVPVLGGHIAEIRDIETGVNPLWVPPWVNESGADFGNDCETRLLESIMGQNLCLDLFGAPSEAEARAGVVAHGEGGILPYTFREVPGGLVERCVLTESQLVFERSIVLEGRMMKIRETVENLSVFDRPIGWTQHITFGPPFLEHGATQFRFPYSHELKVSDAYTAYLMEGDPAWFVAWSPVHKVALGYRWNRADFPWMGIWKENRGRIHTPWNGRTVTQGMEFGVSPFPETRRAMIERARMFDTPCYRWIEAKQTLTAEYEAAIAPAETAPEEFEVLT